MTPAMGAYPPDFTALGPAMCIAAEACYENTYEDDHSALTI